MYGMSENVLNGGLNTVNLMQNHGNNNLQQTERQLCSPISRRIRKYWLKSLRIEDIFRTNQILHQESSKNLILNGARGRT